MAGVGRSFSSSYLPYLSYLGILQCSVTGTFLHFFAYISRVQSRQFHLMGFFHISCLSIYRLRCFPCPIMWGRLHQALPNTSSPRISVLRVNASLATNSECNIHTFRPRLCRPSLLSITRDHTIRNKHDTGYGTLCMAISSGVSTSAISSMLNVYMRYTYLSLIRWIFFMNSQIWCLSCTKLFAFGMREVICCNS